MSEKISRKVESDLLLNVKKTNKVSSDTLALKVEDKRITIDKSLDKYNINYKKAMEAPVPKINLLFNEVLLRAVPAEIRGKHGLILSAGQMNVGEAFKMAQSLDKMSSSVNHEQEILMVGNMITEAEQKRGIRPGLMCKFKMDHMRGISDESQPGMIEHEYNIPLATINGHRYIIIDKRDIAYTYDKDEVQS